jgi:hypothetical protein
LQEWEKVRQGSDFQDSDLLQICYIEPSIGVFWSIGEKNAVDGAELEWKQAH